MEFDVLIDLIISLLVLSIPILLELRRRRPNLFEPILLFNYGFFASYFFKGLLVEWHPDLFITYPDRWSAPAGLNLYFVISWFSLTVFNLGYYYCPTPSSRRGVLAIAPSPYYRLGYLLLILVSVASSLSIVLRIKFDLASLFHSLAAWEDFRAEVMLTWLDGGFAFIGPIFVGFFHLGYEVHARPYYYLAAERIAVAALTTVVMLIIGSRALLLTWILSLLLYHVIWVRPMSLKLQGALLVAFPLAGGILGIIQKITTVGADSLQYPFPLNIFYRLSSSYEQFENLVNLMHARFQFDWGRSIFEDIFLTFLPRAIYAAKPIDYGFMRAQNVLFGDWWEISRATTYPVGIVAELYFNFGYPGILIGMCALGLMLYLLRWGARRNTLFIAPFCALGASFLGPQRWYGAVLMTLGVYLAVGVLCSLIGAFLNHLSDRIVSARQAGERF